MTEEEEKAIHMLKSYAGMTHRFTDNQGRPKLDQAIEIVLNLIQKQQEEIEDWKTDYNHRCQLAIDRKIEIEKKDNIIDLMARAINNYDSQLVINTFRDTQQVKEHFKKKAEEN